MLIRVPVDLEDCKRIGLAVLLHTREFIHIHIRTYIHIYINKCTCEGVVTGSLEMRLRLGFLGLSRKMLEGILK
jgi:hypothetical protein